MENKELEQQLKETRDEIKRLKKKARRTFWISFFNLWCKHY